MGDDNRIAPAIYEAGRSRITVCVPESKVWGGRNLKAIVLNICEGIAGVGQRFAV